MGERFVAVGRAVSSGRTLAVCTGEVRAYAGAEFKVVAIAQATIVHVPRSR